MADQPSARTASAQLAAYLAEHRGVQVVPPTEEERDEHRRVMEQGDAEVAAIIHRRQQLAA